MAKYSVFFRGAVKKDFRPIPKQDVQKILKVIDSLADNPRLPGFKKLSGEEKYRVRCGKYRIIYSIHDAVLEVWVVKVAHRKSVYRS